MKWSFLHVNFLHGFSQYIELGFPCKIDDGVGLHLKKFDPVSALGRSMFKMNLCQFNFCIHRFKPLVKILVNGKPIYGIWILQTWIRQVVIFYSSWHIQYPFRIFLLLHSCIAYLNFKIIVHINFSYLYVLFWFLSRIVALLVEFFWI